VVRGHLGHNLGAVNIALIPLIIQEGEAKMGANGFREEELVSRRVKVGNEWTVKTYPIVAGRLRLAHEENGALSLQTEMVSWDGQYAIFKCSAVTTKGQFIGYGTANSQRDAKLADSLVELAETRSIARALRFAGFGLEFCGAEEITQVPESETAPERTAGETTERVFPEGNGNGKAASKTQNPSNGGGKATQAQARALFALTKKAKMGEEDIAGLLSPFNVTRFEDLTLPDASRLIQSLQTEVAA